jgi:ribosomal subunit interface protein
MQLQIRSKGFALTEGIRSHVERRVGFSLDRFQQEVRNVVVWLWDVNGHKGGGDDKRCRIAVRLRRGNVILEEAASDLYIAMDRAIGTAGKLVARGTRRPARAVSLRLGAADLDHVVCNR